MRSMTRTLFFLALITVLCISGTGFAQEEAETGGMEGFVREATFFGGPSDPIPGATINLHGTGEDYQELTISPVASTVADENGHYSFEDIPSSYYMAIVSADGYETINVPVLIFPGTVIKKNFFLRSSESTPTPTPTPTSTPVAIVTVGHGPDFDYQSITSALDSVESGATILVDIDEYTTETGEVYPIEVKKGILLKAMMNDSTRDSAGNSRPVIRGDRSGPVLKFIGSEDSLPPVMEGFFITGGKNIVGGGILCEDSNVKVLNCVISDNIGAGAVFCSGGAPRFINCVIAHNYNEGGYGAGIRTQDNTDARFTNCKIVDNYTPSYAGGAYCREGVTTFVNCTIADNASDKGGGGIYTWLPDTKVFVHNSIIWNNKGGGVITGREESDISISVDYSCVQGGYPGDGNIDEAPLFVSDGNYHLDAGSPCIDAAHNRYAPGFDLDFNPRPIDGNGDGKRIADMGCYEVQEVTPTPTPPAEVTLKGKVVEDVGMLTIVPPPIAGAEVAIYEILSSVDDPTSPIGKAITKEDGTYEIPGLPGGDVFALVTAEDYFPAKDVIYLGSEVVEKDFELKKIPEPTPTPTPVEQGTLYGTVMGQDDSSTDSESNQHPIEGAVIRGYRYSSGYDETDLTESDRSLVFKAETNENGEYRIPDIDYGKYYVIVRAEGYFGDFSTVAIEEEEVEQNFVLKAFPEPTPTPEPETATIYGTVLGLDEATSETAPVEGAFVELFPPVDCGNTKCYVPPIARAVTDENGKYRIEDFDVEPMLEAIARADGYFGAIENLTLEPGDEKEVNFTLRPGEPEKPAVVFGTVREKSYDASLPGDPIEGAKVEVYFAPVTTDMEEDDRTKDWGEWDPVGEAYTDAEGNYRIEDLMEGAYLVKCSADNYYCAKRIVALYGAPVRVDFSLRPAPEPTPTPEAGVIRGHVYERCCDSTTDPSPIAGADVRIEKVNHIFNDDDEKNGGGSDAVVVKTDENGFYRAENLEAGYYSMKVSAEGYYPRFRHVRLNENREKVANFSLIPKNVEPTPTPEQSGLLYGRVFALVSGASDGLTSPIAGAVIALYQPGHHNSSWEDIEPDYQTETNEKGEYRLEELEAGHYIAIVEASGFYRKVKHVRIVAGESKERNFGLRKVIDPEPTPEPVGNIAGKVYGYQDDSTLLPIEGADVLVFEEDMIEGEQLPSPVKSATTDSDGAFMIPGLDAGDYVVLARASGYEPATKAAEVEPGETVRVILKLRLEEEPIPTPVPEYGSLEGTVGYEEDGAVVPISSARVTAVPLMDEEGDMMGSRTARRAATDEQGFYRFEDMTPGRYMLIARAQGFKPGHNEAEVNALETTIADFILEKKNAPTTDTGTIYGEVRTIDFETTGIANRRIPLEGVDVIVLNVVESLDQEEALVPAGKAVTDENGAYMVDNLSHGMYTVIAEKDGYSRGMKRARVRPLNETEVDFMLMPLHEEEPEIEEEVVYDNEFDNADDGWNNSGAPDFFNEPEAKRNGSAVSLRSRNNNTFGYWYSSGDAVPIRRGAVYKAEFSITSDQDDISQVPTIRIRINSQNEQHSDVAAINSLGDAAVSPGTGGRIYTHYFAIPDSEICLPETEDDLYVSFDLVNFDESDAADATVTLDWIEINAVSKSSMTEGEEVADNDISVEDYGWETQFTDEFTPPAALQAPGVNALALKAANNTDTYGSWISAESVAAIQGGTVYHVSWEIYSDRADASDVPGIRFRASDADNRLISQKCIFSNAEGDNSPDAMGRFYTLFFVAPAELHGAGLNLAFDLVNFDGSDAPDATVGLRNVTVTAIPADQMP